jgi:hypothetical protein
MNSDTPILKIDYIKDSKNVQFAGSRCYEPSLSRKHKQSLMYGICPHICRSEQNRRFHIRSMKRLHLTPKQEGRMLCIICLGWWMQTKREVCMHSCCKRFYSRYMKHISWAKCHCINLQTDQVTSATRVTWRYQQKIWKDEENKWHRSIWVECERPFLDTGWAHGHQ